MTEWQFQNQLKTGDKVVLLRTVDQQIATITYIQRNEGWANAETPQMDTMVIAQDIDFTE